MKPTTPSSGDPPHVSCCLPALRRQAAMTAVTAGGEDGQEEKPVLHCSRSTRLAEPADPARALFPAVHKTGAIGARAMSGDAIAEMIQRRAGQAGYGPAQTQQWEDTRCEQGLSPRRSGPARTPTPLCDKPGIAAR